MYVMCDMGYTYAYIHKIINVILRYLILFATLLHSLTKAKFLQDI